MTLKQPSLQVHRDEIDTLWCKAPLKCGRYFSQKSASHGGADLYQEFYWAEVGKSCVAILQNCNYELKKSSDETWDSFARGIALAGLEGQVSVNSKISGVLWTALLEVAVQSSDPIEEFIYLCELAYFMRVQCRKKKIPLKACRQILLLNRPPPLSSYEDIDERLLRRMRHEIARTRKKCFYPSDDKRMRNND